MKRTFSCQPLVDDDAQRVLITSRYRFAMKLFRSHVGKRASYLLRALVARTLGGKRYAEITEQDIIVLTYQHVLRFHIPVNQLFIMRILQGRSHLFDLGYDGCWHQAASFRMTLT